ncbi:hypothetical protein MarbSA_14680 [Methanobrevibacter arboriphilus]|uniref:Uncharacterized protein n=1 Tax=Methanobrevibacter arboriphilus TaxID=39441 RepID=A0ACA8R4H3_METAZ|nr:hypothetical protein MarbSA_14680 [Methanobrevibacter arboriphilus]
MVNLLRDVKVQLDNQPELTITSIKVDKDDNSGSIDTNKGTVKTPNTATGGKISIESLELPASVQELIAFEEYLEKGSIEKATFSAIGKAGNGKQYLRRVQCLRGYVVPSSEWKPGDGLTVSFECQFDEIKNMPSALPS